MRPVDSVKKSGCSLPLKDDHGDTHYSSVQVG